MDDPLYGLEPDPAEDFGVRLGTIAARGERGALVVDLEFLLRINCNPFFPYLLSRIEDGVDRPAPAPAGTPAPAATPPEIEMPPPTMAEEPVAQQPSAP